jgi:hypothetical protein
MSLELTEQQRQALAGRPLGPLQLIDPATQRAYVLIAAEQFQRVADFLEPELTAPQGTPSNVPPGIRKSQEALRRELPALLAKKKLLGSWVAYHGDERIGIAPSKVPLLDECLRRGLSDDSYYIGLIDPSELVEVEDVDFGLCEFDEEGDEPLAT